MHLPAEIINEILYELISTNEHAKSKYYPFNDKSPEDWRLLWSDLICTDQYARDQIHLGQSFFSLRLVSRVWNEGISVIIAKHFTWTVDLDSEASLQRALICLSKGTGDSLIPTREIVRKLTIKAGKELHHISSRDDSVNQHFHDRLLSLCNLLGCLESFTLSFPPGNSSELETVNEIVNIIRHYFLQTDVLGSIVDLQLRIPTTYHAGQFLKIIIGDKPTQLHHLLVEIIDSSGKAGSRDYLMHSYSEDSDIDGTAEESDDDDDDEASECERSDLQRRYPNRQYQQELWDFIASCVNLETLSIQGTHFLDLNRLNWQPSDSFPGLRVLALGRVYASISSIRQLLQPSDKNSAPRLQKIILDDVKMLESGGIWGELASFLLKNCVNLDLIYFINLSYFVACNRRAGLSAPEDSTLIDSDDDDDLDPIHELIHTFANKCDNSGTWPFWRTQMVDDLDMEDYALR